MSNKQSQVSRRAFLSNAAIIGASGTLGAGSLLTACSGSNENKFTPLRPASELYIPDLPDKAYDGKPIRAALIGCGGRGTGASVNFLDAADGVSIVACADIFKDRMDRCRARLKEKNNEIADDMCFLGFDAYKKVCDLDVDMVLIVSPEIFHSEHIRYAVEKGKHVCCEKPAAIDVAGYRKFLLAVKQAQTKGLCIITGTQRHHQRGYVESYKKVQEGYIGRIVSGCVYWNQSHMEYGQRQPGWTDMEYMLRCYLYWNWLGGDHVIHQMVHNLDVFTWFSHLKPVRTIGMGARLRRIDGDIYDTFGVDFEFENNVHVLGMARQINNCDDRVAEVIQGTKGQWSSLNGNFIITDLDGNVVWQYDEEAAKAQFKQHDPYTLEHVALINHIRSGKVVNIAETTATSSMACIMARESAYTGKAYTWDEMVQTDLNFTPDEWHLGNVDMSKFKIPLPGTAPMASRLHWDGKNT
jgi:predicted dehydrogenase